MKNIVIALILLLLVAFVWANTAPVVSNATMTQRTDGSKLVDITYDLADAENDACTVIISISSDGGSTFPISPAAANLSGAIGSGIAVGIGKSIIWNIGDEGYTLNLDTYRVRVQADDDTIIPSNFVFVEGGTFNNGRSDVTVSSFYLSRCETSQAEYLEVIGTNPSFVQQINNPVDTVCWFQAIEYCNKRSILEGLIPCYTYSTYGTDTDTWPEGWLGDYLNHTNVSCNWSADGYRLPTDAEWEFAARGGNLTHGYTYSGSNDLSEVGWWGAFNGGNSPALPSPVGTLAANELGFFDMSGNVHEPVWDICDFGPYSSDPQTNPHGPDSGSVRVFRGGCWVDRQEYCTVYYRYFTDAAMGDCIQGFRVCRNAL